MTLVLCLPGGRVLGALPAFPVAVPWWPDVAAVVAGALERYGTDVTVLRLLSADVGQMMQGGPVTYLAQVGTAPSHPLQAWPDDPAADAPHRLSYARPGGPDADLAWADDALAGLGRRRTAPAEQMRTWNLSSIWRLPTAQGPVWLKVVPPFFAHEGAILAVLDPAVVPRLLATADGRMLMDDVPGADQYDAPVALLLRMVGLLVDLQAAWAGRVGELIELGLPDWRAARFTVLAGDTVRRSATQLDRATLSRLDVLLNRLPARLAAIAACGLADTLVHGDFHPGNVHGSDEALVLLDWGDCGVGHPLLDQAAFTGRLTDSARAEVRTEWARLWRAAVPGSEPERAAVLIEPVAALRQALIYQHFLDNIEEDEQVYHVHDPVAWLQRAGARAGP